MYKLTTDDPGSTAPELHQTLDELAREGARRMIVEALQLEVEEYVSRLRHLRDEQGHALVVRNGTAQERTVHLGAGSMKIKAPRVDDRRPDRRWPRGRDGVQQRQDTSARQRPIWRKNWLPRPSLLRSL